MVAETHSHRDDIDPDDIITLVARHLDQIDSTTTLADCGYPDELALYDLVDLLADEYGERSLTPIDADDLRPATATYQVINTASPPNLSTTPTAASCGLDNGAINLNITTGKYLCSKA